MKSREGKKKITHGPSPYALRIEPGSVCFRKVGGKSWDDVHNSVVRRCGNFMLDTAGTRWSKKILVGANLPVPSLYILCCKEMKMGNKFS